MKHVDKALLLVSAVLLLALAVGCGQSRIQIGWVESNLPGSFAASYVSFSGSEVRTVRADAGETLVLQYAAEVNEGTLAIMVEAPDGEMLWNVSLEEDAEDMADFPVEQDGRYSIVVRSDGTAGSFDLSWGVE
jgi:hypothetical protein